ncbi:hypothetical protein Ancab_002020 [Ancistrocladus abbreviatus]
MLIKIGPAGGDNRRSSDTCSPQFTLGVPMSEWDDKGVPMSEWDDKGKTEVVGILISHGYGGINALQFQHYQEDQNEDGRLVLSGTLSNEFKGPMFNRIVLDYPSERITWVRGYDENDCIRALTFGTNQRSYGPFGGDASWQEFRFEFGDQGEFAGFYGSYDSVLRSIGAYFKPITTLTGLTPKKPVQPALSP